MIISFKEKFPFKETEQFGIVCSIEGHTRELIFRIINSNNSTNSSKINFTDSMSSLSSVSTLSSCTRHGNNKTDVLYYLSKAMSDDRCLLDKVNRRRISSLHTIVSILVFIDSNDESSSNVLFANITGLFRNRFQFTFDK